MTETARAAESSDMSHPALESLLILQDRDMKRRSLEAQVKGVPRDIASIEQKIASEKEAIQTFRAELMDLEVKKKGLETEIGSAENRVAQYRTQQLSIRKNEEYQAMGHQIETILRQVSGLEGQELELMYAIDEAKRKFVAAEAELKANISSHEARMSALRERETSLAVELKAADADVAAARAPVIESRLRYYDRIAVRNMPAIVPIVAGKCGGCHLKVSSEVESAARSKTHEQNSQLPTCDQCGRMVYWEI